jgi:GT2 family glycosyltransferase
MPPRARLSHPRHVVTAVLVAHDGASWLPETLAALAAQTRPPQHLVGVDTGSTDASPSLIEERFGAERVVRLDAATGYPDAVAAGLAAADQQRPAPRRRAADLEAGEPVRWVWLLHDDSAPEPGALAALLEAAETAPSAAVLGCKARDWADPRLLVEVGITTDRAGRRETGLERREFDQGQHDSQRDVLAVGTAGLLVRRDVWDALGGLDPALPLGRDEIDLGWRANAAGHRVVIVPTAVVRHARAWSTGRRPGRALTAAPHTVDRRHGLAVLLWNVSLPALLLGIPRWTFGALLRAFALLLTRQVSAARDELAALGWNMAHALDVVRARRRRRQARTRSDRSLRHLFASPVARLRGYADAAATWLTGGVDEIDEDALVADLDEEALPHRAHRRGSRLLRNRPGLGLVLGLLVVALAANRALLGGGRLVGGGLLPPPTGAEDWLAAYLSSAPGGGLGEEGPAAPALAVLGLLSGLLLGKGWLAVDVLVLGCAPLAGLSAWWASRRVDASRRLRLWAAATYAVLPTTALAVGSGRLDLCVAVVATPLVLAGVHSVLTNDPRHNGWRGPFAVGLGLALAAALAPQLWLLATLLLAVGGGVLVVGASPATRTSAVRRAAAAVLTAATPLAVLHPWTWEVVRRPRLLLAGPSGPATGERPLGVLDALLLRPGATDGPIRWLLAGVVLAALAGLLRRRGRRTALVAWAVVLAAGTWALVLSRGAGLDRPASAVPALGVVACGLLVAGLVAAARARERLAAVSFGWRQPAAAAVALVALVAPLALAVSWVVDGVRGPLERRSTVQLPAVAVAETRAQSGSRVLWLDTAGSGAERQVRYSLAPSTGLTAADAVGTTTVDGPASDVVDGLVAELVTLRGTDAADSLATFAVRFVAVAEPVEPELAEALDAQAGLSRVAFGGEVQLWRTVAPSARLSLLPPELAGPAREGEFNTREALRTTPPQPLPSRRESATATVPPGPEGRLLVLAEGADEGWEATIDGEPMERLTAYGWAQAFAVPALGGTIELRRDQGPRGRALAVQGVLLAVVMVLAAPSVRRDDTLTDEPPAPAEPEETDPAPTPTDDAPEPADSSHVVVVKGRRA